MLFKRELWAGLADGTVTLTFRRWRRLQVKPGGRYRTPVGVLAVDAVDLVDPAGISDQDARRAGFAGRAALLRELDRYGDGRAYRIAFHFAGPDPREALRRADDLDDDEWARLTARLDRLDRASPHGAWTLRVLRLIAERPGERAADLAASIGRDRASFKLDVRKLKELGLSESLEVGYRLSPRGRALLARLDANADTPR
jgi:DNA-binding MarR family transcriptional regulator